VPGSLVLAVRQLEPPFVGLDRSFECCRRLLGSAKRARHHGIDLVLAQQELGDRRCLGSSVVVEVLIETPLQQTGSIRRRSTVTYEDQHRGSVPQATPVPEGSAETLGHRVELPVTQECPAPGGITQTVVSPQPDADRHTHGLQQHTPPTASDHRQQGVVERQAEEGHQNTSVSLQAPANTRWRIIPIGRPSSALRMGLRPDVATISTASNATLTVTLWSALAPPKTPSRIGSTDPTISSR
jgi:hypothetical protein